MPDHGIKAGIDPAAVLQAAAESILITTASLEPPGPKILYANPAFEKMTGWSCEEIVGHSPRILQGEKTDMGVFRSMRRTLQTGGTWEGLALNYRKDGSSFWMEWSITGLRDAGGSIYQYLAVQRDVTARVEMEARLQRTQQAAQAAERARANLARYFPPNLVEALAAKDQPLGTVAQQDLAVLFADIVGFTKLSEGLEPARVIHLLRDIHAWMQRVIFKWNGSIEGYIGDEVLAIFGFPEREAHSASNALACAQELLRSAKAWNLQRGLSGEPAVHIGVGLHYGPVVLGDVGTADFVEFTVIGDTVNIASRLQKETRRLNCDLVVGEPLVAAIQSEPGARDLGRLRRFGEIDIRGRSHAVEIWIQSRDER